MYPRLFSSPVGPLTRKRCAASNHWHLEGGKNLGSPQKGWGRTSPTVTISLQLGSPLLLSSRWSRLEIKGSDDRAPGPAPPLGVEDHTRSDGGEYGVEVGRIGRVCLISVRLATAVKASQKGLKRSFLPSHLFAAPQHHYSFPHTGFLWLILMSAEEVSGTTF